MEKLKIETIVSGTNGNNNWREFIKKSILLGALTGIGGITLFDSCKTQIEENSAVENLMWTRFIEPVDANLRPL